MKQKGIEWVSIGGIDNILLNIVDEALIGLTLSEENLLASKSVKKTNPEERAGVFAKVNNKPTVIEYTEIPKNMANEKNEDGDLVYGEVNILNHLINLELLEEISNKDLPYHIAIKKANYLNEKKELIKPDEPNAYKFETFIFDGFKYCNEMSILRVKREKEFAPIKNATGNDSPETAKKLYEEYCKKIEKNS